MLFAIIVLWTPPHFWALALLIKKDYERAGVPMLPNVRGDAVTQRQIFLYTIVLVASTLLLLVHGVTGIVYGVAAVCLAVPLIFLASVLYRSRPSSVAAAKWANRLFWYSNTYLALLFAAMAIDRIVR